MSLFDTKLAYFAIHQLCFCTSNVRIGPGLDYSRVGEVPGSAEFDVLDGPICADGFAWWQVHFENTTGWTAEGQDENYWLEPVE